MGDLITEFVDKKIVKALENFLECNNEDDAKKACIQIAGIFGGDKEFKKISESKSEEEKKLVESFNKNLILLIQKTWVEKSDEALKAQVLYQLEEFSKQFDAQFYTISYSLFFSILDDVVYLMFGNQSKAKDFLDYALRIDPEFGIFWWYVSSLPRKSDWEDTKCRIAILLGMYFLANY